MAGDDGRAVARDVDDIKPIAVVYFLFRCDCFPLRDSRRPQHNERLPHAFPPRPSGHVGKQTAELHISRCEVDGLLVNVCQNALKCFF